MTTIEAAVIKEQDVMFAVVAVKPFVFNSQNCLDDARSAFQRYFPGMPIVLMKQDHRGLPEYQGRTDIVTFLSHVHPGNIPWKRFNFN
ncbi:hypothetical protein [Desulfovibrio sp. TomC]|uniref:hypothetical protein n=1 Tax=Desulfovibrio sp. TomC TaxID=1562888 RepID=UPI0009E55D79|nr:hypothetical protein [Desulfovibrio sp. TomC]